jgi:hypothetical protein
VDLESGQPDEGPSPLEAAIGRQALDRFSWVVLPDLSLLHVRPPPNRMRGGIVVATPRVSLRRDD